MSVLPDFRDVRASTLDGDATISAESESRMNVTELAFEIHKHAA